MSKLNVVVVSGNLGSPSKTLVLANQIVEAVKNQANVNVQIHQVADLAGEFGPARNPKELSDVGREVIKSIESADLLVAVSPVYKASYTGLFKHIFDFIDPLALLGVPVILGATGGGEKHGLIIEHQLRPLFGFFGAFTVPSGIYASDQNFDGTRFQDAVVLERIEQAARQGVELALSQSQRKQEAVAA